MNTAIEWTDVVWNPTTGCDRVSPGCDNCYALTLAKRLKAMGQPKYQRDGDPRTSGPGFGLTVHPDAVNLPLRWRTPRRVFVNSMSDLFHKDVPDEWIAQVFAVMAQTPQHTYQVLTKRHARMKSLLRSPDFEWEVFDRQPPGPRMRTGWPLPNVWIGVSVEDQRWANIRIPSLLDTPAAVRFLSCEPLLGPVDLRHWLDPTPACGCGGEPGGATFGCSLGCMLPQPSGLHWAIIGGESGPGARPMGLGWARSLVEQCQAAGVPVFVKQLGTVVGGTAHHDIDTFPPELRVREYPRGAAT